MPSKTTIQNIQSETPFPAWRLPNGINKASDNGLEYSAASCERWVIASGLLVVLGLIVEAVIAFVHPSYDSPVGTWAPFIADTLVALGVAGEVLFTMMSSRRHNELWIRSNTKLADAITQAGEANQKAQEASLELARLTAPRILTQEQRGRIVEKLKKFSGTEYDIAISSSDPEILDFVFLVEVALSTAEWTGLDWQGPAECLIREGEPLVRLGVTIGNVVIVVHVNQPPKVWECALALSDALIAEDIDATARRHTPHAMSSTNANAIHILIGRKI